MGVYIVETGLANVASVAAAFKRLGQDAKLTTNTSTIEKADFVVLPGVGSFGAGMAQLERLKLVDPLRDRINEGKPTLGICLGLQLLAQCSEESPGVSGIGCIETEVTAFPSSVRRPQFGWNWLANENTAVLGEGGYVYYANSFRMTACPAGWTAGWTNYGGQFIGCLQRGAVVTCQFHPELSGRYGGEILNRWLLLGGQTPC